MICRRSRNSRLICALALAGFVAGARAQEVILYLRNGDRIAGRIVSENTNQVVVSTVWIKELAIPLAQIAGRELPALGTNALSSPTNAALPVKAPATMAAISNAVPATTNWFKRHFKGEVAVGATLVRGATDNPLPR